MSGGTDENVQPIPKRLRFQIYRRDRYTCRYCGHCAPDVALVIDHVIPRSRGGTNAAANLVTACEDCNIGKGNDLPELWLSEEIEKLAREFADKPWSEDDGDPGELEEEIYQVARYFLERQTGEFVLYWLGQAYIAARPYKPQFYEAIMAAARLSRQPPDQPDERNPWGAGAGQGAPF